MKEKITIEIVDKYLRDKKILKDNEKASDIFIKLDKNKEPIELLINRVDYPTDKEKEDYYLYLGETSFYENIPEEDSKYLLENYDFEYLFNDSMYFSIDNDLQEYLDKEDLKKEKITIEDIDKCLRDKNKQLDFLIVMLKSQENSPIIYLKIK